MMSSRIGSGGAPGVGVAVGGATGVGVSVGTGVGVSVGLRVAVAVGSGVSVGVGVGEGATISTAALGPPPSVALPAKSKALLGLTLSESDPAPVMPLTVTV